MREYIRVRIYLQSLCVYVYTLCAVYDDPMESRSLDHSICILIPMGKMAQQSVLNADLLPPTHTVCLSSTSPLNYRYKNYKNLKTSLLDKEYLNLQSSVLSCKHKSVSV